MLSRAHPPWRAFHIQGKVAVFCQRWGETTHWAIAYYNGSWD